MDLGPYLLFASLEGLVHAAVLSLIALGLSLVFGVMRIVNVAHGEFFMLGAILTWWVSNFVMGNPALGFLLALLIVQFVAFPATLIYSKIGDKIGTKNSIFMGIIGYSILTFFGAFMYLEWHFYTLAIFIGLFQGGIQALSRSLFSRIIPKNKSAEFFGFYNMLGLSLIHI